MCLTRRSGSLAALRITENFGSVFPITNYRLSTMDSDFRRFYPLVVLDAVAGIKNDFVAHLQAFEDLKLGTTKTTDLDEHEMRLITC